MTKKQSGCFSGTLRITSGITVITVDNHTHVRIYIHVGHVVWFYDFKLRVHCCKLSNAHGQLPRIRFERVAIMSRKEWMLIFLWTSCLSAAPDKYYIYDLEAKKGGNIFHSI